ncbi:MAG TPA: FlaD/FlaE family flagellar protein [Candidatus Thermoplasmatota archaeon]|nr:FlaD/FlaE family flagellar protein [Candidatus Thermoplasmatota archaeon]
MSRADENTTDGTLPLDNITIQEELKVIVQRNQLPPRIAQKIGEKVNERGIKITKDQLYHLVQKIQDALHSYTPINRLGNQQNRGTAVISQREQQLNDQALQHTDMKRLMEEMENLDKRITIVEESNLQGVNAGSQRLIRTRDIRTEPPVILEDTLQPLVQTPNDPESIVVIMKWLQYLVDKTGKNNLPDVLGYYVDIGWISDTVRLDLIDYSKGLVEDPSPTTPRTAQLPTRDHLQSLLFIQKLKGVQLDERFIDKIQRDMEKMAKSLEGYQVK